MKITLGNFDDPRVKALLTYHLEGMHANSPPGHVFALDWSGLQKPDISFWTIWKGDALCGCGALKQHSPSHGEIKSMRVLQQFLGQGVGKAMLLHIIGEARARDYRRLSLETGSGAAFEAALKLYEAHGFQYGETFADYEKTEFNNLMHLDL